MERQLQLIWDENRKYPQIHDGWVYVLSRRSHGFASFVGKRMVLKRKVILLYDDDRLTDAVILGSNIRLKNVIPAADSQPGFGFEIESLTSSGQTKSTCFMFKQQNERDYWKALILAMLQGTIPQNVDLLPGQVAHIRELISRSVADFPAPPTYRSPSAEAEGQRETGHQQTVYHPGHGGGHQGFRHMADTEVDVVYELTNRQRMLSQGMLEKEMPRVLVPQLQSSHRHGHSSSPPPSDPPPSPPSVGLSARRRGVSIGQEEATESRLRRAATANGRPSQQTTRSPPLRQEDWHYVNKNPNQVHPFYRNSAMNGETPSWFIDCNRDVAETVLSVGRRYGNLLMRPGRAANCQHQMCYALSYRNYNEETSHFAIIRQPDGFKIDVDDEHAPMPCLLDVVEYFMNFVGSSVQPFQSNNLNEILHCDLQTVSRGLRLALPSSSSPSSPPVVGHSVLPEHGDSATPSIEDLPTPYQSPGASLPPLLASSDYLIPRQETELSFPKKPSHHRVTFSGNSTETTHKTLSKHNSSSSSSSAGVYSPTSDRLASPLRVPPPPLFPLPSSGPETVMEDNFLQLPPKI